jgi:hypothetical protein
MISNAKESLGLLGKNVAQTYYRKTPFRCCLADVVAVAALSDIGDADTVTIINEDGDTVGVATFGSDIAAGAKATFVLDATNGGYIFEANESYTVVVSQLDAETDRVFVDIEWDIHAISHL